MEFLATEPAFSILRSAANDVYSFTTARTRYPALPAYEGPDRVENDDLRDRDVATSRVRMMAGWLRSYLTVSRPDAVVMMDANEQLGVEQVVAVAAREMDIPAVRVRDSWGTATGVEAKAMRRVLPERLRRAALATRYFEIDGQGSELSWRRLGIPRRRLREVHGLMSLDRLVGKVTVDAYRRARASLGVKVGAPLIVYFAQPTGHETAEAAAFQALVTGLNAAGLGARGVILATQEHPREKDARDGRLGLGWTARRATGTYQGDVLDLSQKVLVEGSVDFVDTMVAADIFVSTYSNSSVEATVLGATALDDVPPAWRSIGLHLLCPAIVPRVMRARRAGLAMHPFAEAGAVPCVLRAEEVGPTLETLLFQPGSRAAYFARLRDRYHLGSTASLILDEVCRIVGRHRRRCALP